MPPKPRPKRSVDPDGRVTVAGKVANREGSIYFVKAEQTWRATYYLAGEHRPRVVRGRTRDEAQHRRQAALETLKRSRRPTRFSAETTLGEMAAWWLEHVARHRVRASSLGKLRDRLSDERLGRLVDVPVAELSAEQVTTWMSELLDGGLSPSTVSDTRSTLRQVIAAAYDHGVVATNVVERVRPPKVRRRPGRALTPDDVRRLLGAADGYRYSAAIAILFTSGWRVSEVLGLAWSDVDLDKGIAVVRRAVTYVDGAGQRLGPTKTTGAQGVHRLAPGVIARLKQWSGLQAEERLVAGSDWVVNRWEGKSIDLVFTQPGGALVARQQIAKSVRRAAEAAGLDASKLGTHAGRRSVVTALYTAGVELGDVARHVGHASTATTAGYVGALGDRPERTAALAAQLLDSHDAPRHTTT